MGAGPAQHPAGGQTGDRGKAHAQGADLHRPGAAQGDPRRQRKEDETGQRAGQAAGQRRRRHGRHAPDPQQDHPVAQAVVLQQVQADQARHDHGQHAIEDGAVHAADPARAERQQGGGHGPARVPRGQRGAIAGSEAGGAVCRLGSGAGGQGREEGREMATIPVSSLVARLSRPKRAPVSGDCLTPLRHDFRGWSARLSLTRHRPIWPG